MSKNLQHQDTGLSIDTNHPGCMWGILHVLHYQRWHQVRKKMLLHKKQGGARHPTVVANPENSTNTKNAGEMQNHTDAEMKISLNEEKAAEPTPVPKSSMKSRIKSLISDELSKRRGKHRRSSSSPMQLQLTRTDSIHHLEPSDLSPLTAVASNDASLRNLHQDENSCAPSSSEPLEAKFCEEPETSKKKCELCTALLTANHTETDLHFQDKLNKPKQDLLAQGKESETDVPCHHSKQFLDVLDIFSMDKELFLRVLQNPSSPLVHHFHGRQEFNAKVRGFTKSMSFPLARLSVRRDSEPTELKLEHERDSCAKREEKTGLECTEGTSDSSLLLGVESRTGVPKPYTAKPESLDILSSRGSSTELKNNKGGAKHFKNLKQKIKHAIKESRKERRRITMDAVLHKIPYGRKFSKDDKEETAHVRKEMAVDKHIEFSPQSSRGSDPNQQFRRILSFDGSLDRYRQLYESSFSAEAKHRTCERSKLRTDKTPSSSGTFPKTLGRILSSPELGSNFNLQSEDSPDATTSAVPIRTDMNSNVGVDGCSIDERKTSGLRVGSENKTPLDAPVESRSKNNKIELGEPNIVAKCEVGLTSSGNEEAEDNVGFSLDGLGSLTGEESDVLQENEIEVHKLAEPSSSQEDTTSPTRVPSSEESRLEPENLLFHEAKSSDSSSNQLHEESADSDRSRVNLDKTETSIEQLSSQFLQVLSTKDEADFNYVKYVLDLSGFSRCELQGTWHSPDQPVDPSVFEELKGCLVTELDYPESEEGDKLNHPLLFDLINEVLLEIYEKSFTYCPKPLTTTSHIRPVPVGYHVLEEVWANISQYLSWRPQADQPLDHAVTLDLARNDGWMDLQFEAECVGLELEDMIFDDLLDELGWTSSPLS